MHYLALVPKRDRFEIALLEKKNGNDFTVVALQIFDTIDDVKQLYISLTKKNRRIVTGLPSKDVLYRIIECTVPKNQSLASVLPFQIEDLLPYPSEEAIVHPLPIVRKGEVSFFSTCNHLVEKHLDALRNHEIDPDLISCETQALLRFFQTFFPEKHSGILFFWGEESSSCIAIEENQLVLSQSLPIGNRLLDEALKLDHPKLSRKERIERSNQEAKGKKKLVHFEEALEKCSSQLKKLVQFLSSKHLSIENSYVVGEYDVFTPVHHLLDQALGSSEKPSAFRGICFSILEKHAVSLGLALDALKEKQRIQFRQETFCSPTATKRVRKRLGTFWALSLASLSLLFCFGNFLLTKKREAIHTSLRQVFPSNIYLQNDLEAELDRYDREIIAQKPFQPLVLDFSTPETLLCWIDTNPALQGKALVEQIEYTLIDRPELGGKSTSYVGQASLLIRFEEEDSLAEFEESLTAATSPASQKGKITVTPIEPSLYQIEFTLKKKEAF